MTKQNYILLFILTLATQTHLQAAQMNVETKGQEEKQLSAEEKAAAEQMFDIVSEKNITDKAKQAGKLQPFLQKYPSIINQRDTLGYTALIWAAINNNEVIAQMLIEAGANLNIQSNFGTNALMEAVLSKNNNMIQSLIAAGADLNLQDNTLGSTVLMKAIFARNKDLVKMLVAAGADQTIRNKLDLTAFDIAIKKEFGDEYQAAVAAGEKEKAARRAQYNREIIEPMIVESIEEVDFPPELAGEVAEYANIDVNSRCRKRKR